MHAKKVLVVDDEKKITEVLRSYLEREAFTVLEAYDGKEAMRLFQTESPHLIILDLMLPDISGEEICKAIRQVAETPIILLTAKTGDEHILNGFGLGADDYVQKPFSPRQVIARVKAVLKRVFEQENVQSGVYRFEKGDLVIEESGHVVRKQSREVSLTPNEFKILMLLVKNPKRTFTREELISMAFDSDFDGYDRTVDVHMKNIRQKIETDTKSPIYIVTVYGVGYKFGGEADACC